LNCQPGPPGKSGEIRLHRPPDARARRAVGQSHPRWARLEPAPFSDSPFVRPLTPCHVYGNEQASLTKEGNWGWWGQETPLFSEKEEASPVVPSLLVGINGDEIVVLRASSIPCGSGRLAVGCYRVRQFRGPCRRRSRPWSVCLLCQPELGEFRPPVFCLDCGH
jgi:hypothetical protein